MRLGILILYWNLKKEAMYGSITKTKGEDCIICFVLNNV